MIRLDIHGKSQEPVTKAVLFFCAALLFIYSFTIYSKSIQNEFVWDSVGVIVEDPQIRNTANIPGFFVKPLTLGKVKTLGDRRSELDCFPHAQTGCSARSKSGITAAHQIVGALLIPYHIDARMMSTLLVLCNENLSGVVRLASRIKSVDEGFRVGKPHPRFSVHTS